MTTLAQDGLPKDSEILRTLARYNSMNASVYASVLPSGTIWNGDTVRLVE